VAEGLAVDDLVRVRVRVRVRARARARARASPNANPNQPAVDDLRRAVCERLHVEGVVVGGLLAEAHGVGEVDQLEARTRAWLGPGTRLG